MWNLLSKAWEIVRESQNNSSVVVWGAIAVMLAINGPPPSLTSNNTPAEVAQVDDSNLKVLDQSGFAEKTDSGSGYEEMKPQPSRGPASVASGANPTNGGDGGGSGVGDGAIPFLPPVPVVTSGARAAVPTAKSSAASTSSNSDSPVASIAKKATDAILSLFPGTTTESTGTTSSSSSSSSGDSVVYTTTTTTTTSTSVTPTVTSVTPSSGPLVGGTTITIYGTNFSTGMTVTIGTNGNCSSVTIISETEATCVTPPMGTGGTYNVKATLSSGTYGTLASSFTYATSPVVSSVSPNNGETFGGTLIAITGNYFASGATVTVGGTTCTSPSVASATSMTCVTGQRTAQNVNVVVTNPDTLNGTLVGGYTYRARPSFRQIASAGTSSGSTGNGTAVYKAITNSVTGKSLLQMY